MAVVVMAITTGVACKMDASTGLLVVAMEEAATAEETLMAVEETTAVVDTEAEAVTKATKVTQMEEATTEVLKATAAAWEVAEEATAVEAWVVLAVAACNATRTTLSSSVALER